MSWGFKSDKPDATDAFTPVSSHTNVSSYGPSQEHSWAFSSSSTQESKINWAYSTTSSPSSDATKAFYSSKSETESSWAFSSSAQKSGTNWAYSSGSSSSFGGSDEKKENWAYSNGSGSSGSGNLSSGWLSSSNKNNSWGFSNEKPGSSGFGSHASADGFGFGRDSMVQFLKDRDKSAEQGWEAKHWGNCNEYLERQGQLDFLRGAEEKDSSKNFWGGGSSWAYSPSKNESSSSKSESTWAFSSPKSSEPSWAFGTPESKKEIGNSSSSAFAPVSSLFRPFGSRGGD